MGVKEFKALKIYLFYFYKKYQKNMKIMNKQYPKSKKVKIK